MLGLRRNILTGGAPHKDINTGVFGLIANVGAGAGANGSTTAAIDTTGAKLIVLSLHGYAATPTAIVLDSKGNTYLPLTFRADLGLQIYQQLFYCINPIVGAGHTFASSGSASFSGVNVQAYSCTKNPVYASLNTTNETLSGNTMNAGNINSIYRNGLFVTGICVFNTPLTTPFTLDLGYTVTDQQAYSPGANFANSMGYKVQPLKGANNPLWSWFNGNYAVCSHALFISV